MRTTERHRGRASGGERRLPVGAELTAEGVHFRVFAPERNRVEVAIEGAPEPLSLVREEGGYWSGIAPRAAAGTRYRYRLHGEGLFPDPASRFQPDGPHGPSEVIDPGTFTWSDGGWRGIELKGQVIYELHLGTFSEAGTFEGARQRLGDLRALGVTTVELMPVAAFPGAFGWGYDGVNLYAPYAGYGRPDDLRRLVDEAHGLGLGVLLDVVYNHFGPDGNYLRSFAREYFSNRNTEWGEALNFDGPGAAATRELVAANAAYWIDEFHLDGLRLDAVQAIHDESPEHILVEISRRARAAAGGRSILLTAENESQLARVVRPLHEGGFGFDAVWNDDFHHTSMVALVGRREGYYTDYLGAPQELISTAKYGFLFQGQWYGWQKMRRGTATRGLAPKAFLGCLENHDQVANSVTGERIWQRAHPASHRAMTAYFLLGPWTPLLFQGQEWNSSRPFLFFADHNPQLGTLVRKGRAEFLAQFPHAASPEVRESLADPGARETFAASRLDWSEATRPEHDRALALHRDLLALRRTDPVIAAQGEGDVRIDGAVLGVTSFALRLFGPNDDDRLLLVNLGADQPLSPVPEPLLAPPAGQRWTPIWSSESPRYGGSGTPPIDGDDGVFRVPGQAAILLRGVRSPDRDRLGLPKEER